MLYEDVKQYKQLTVFNDPQKYDIDGWEVAGKCAFSGNITKVSIKNYHEGQDITWVKIKYVKFVTEPESQDPNILFKNSK